MGLFDGPLFDFDGNGKEDLYDSFIGMQMTATSREEAIALTGDDTFYPGTDYPEDDDIDDDIFGEDAELFRDDIDFLEGDDF